MTADGKEENKCSEKKMDVDDGLKTVECLRGRLLAERQASRTAKEEAELLGQKLTELENKLKEEIKLRDKAEKKLNFLMKKVKSLKISPTSEDSEQCSSTSENCNSSCRSTTTSVSGPREPEQNESQIQQNLPEKTLDHNAVDNGSTTEENSSSSCVDDSKPTDNAGENFTSDEAKIDNQSTSSSKDSRMEMNANEGPETDEDYVDNSLALVPISPPARNEQKMVNIDANVGEVLDNLRQLREKLQSSLQKRGHMIEVGPA